MKVKEGVFLRELLKEERKKESVTNNQTVAACTSESIAHLEGCKSFHLHYANLCSFMSIVKVVDKERSDEIYNLATQSHVQVSFDSPVFMADI